MANQTEQVTQCLYKGTVEIIFYPNSHRYKIKGSKTFLISVTAITGIIDKSRVLIDWALRLANEYVKKFFEESKAKSFTPEEILPVIEEALNQHNVKRDAAADSGTQVHDLAQRIGEALRDNQNLPHITDELPESVKNGITGFIDWVVEHNVKFIDCERMVYSKKHGFVGLVDAIIELDGKRYLVDYKTSKGVYSEMKYQVAGYTIAYEEELGRLDGQMIVHFNKENGAFTTHLISKKENKKNQKTFLACLKVKQREKELSKF